MDDVYWLGNENSREPYYQTARVFLESKMFSCKKMKISNNCLFLAICLLIKVGKNLKNIYSFALKKTL